jgi:AraC-like DNA-binding protein
LIAVSDQTTAAPEIHAWKPRVPGVREVLHATFTDHAYPLHTHDAWTLFIVDDGQIRYDLHRHARGADRSTVGILPPHVVHDGRTHGPGYHKRVLYLESAVIGQELIGAAVDESSVQGAGLRSAIAAVHDTISCADDALEAETRLAFVTERIRRALGARTGDAKQHRTDLAEQLRAFLDDHLVETVTMSAASVAIGADQTQLARAFVAAFNIPPHAYVLGRRLDLARDRILDGEPLADVAAAVGFFDQAHMTRRFKRFLGTTPGRFAGY